MIYTDFKTILPYAKTSSADFAQYLDYAEIIIQDLIVYQKSELTTDGLTVYNKAVALQIEFINTNSGQVEEDNITSQSINGTSLSFANSGKRKVLICDMALKVLQNAGLTVK